MTEYDWVSLLDLWKRDILDSHFVGYERETPQSLWSAGQIGAPGATEGQLAEVERRLGVALPPSYRHFLATMNGGWFLTHSWEPYHFWSTEEVEWFGAREGRWLETWIVSRSHPTDEEWIPDDEYFHYEQGVAWGLRDAYRKHTLALSARGDGGTIYLLNPCIVTLDGEWEAWSIDLDEPRRFPSFWEMLRREYQTFLRARVRFERNR